MRKKRNVLYLICLALILLCVTNCENITRSLVSYYFEQREADLELPDWGSYACSEVNMTFKFGSTNVSTNILAVCPDGSKEQVYVDFGGRFLFGDGIVAFYKWDQKKDILSIKFDHAPDGIAEDVTFQFSRMK